MTDDKGLKDDDSATVTVRNVAPSLSLTSCPVAPNAVNSDVPAPTAIARLGGRAAWGTLRMGDPDPPGAPSRFADSTDDLAILSVPPTPPS